MATEELPPEIIAYILSRLPPKPLCRFKCVSKPWNSLINSPSFIKLQFNNSALHPRHLIVSHHTVCSAVIPAVDDAVFHFSELNHPLSGETPVNPIASCNGVVLIAVGDKKSFCLFNPITSSHRLIPPAPSTHQNSTFKFEAYGLGYDSVSDDYKVVKSLFYFVKRQDVYFETCVYSLKKDSWHFVPDEFEFLLQVGNPVFSGGTLHFIVSSNNGRTAPVDSRKMLKCFDLTTEKISLVDFPTGQGYAYTSSNGDRGLTSLSMSELRGRICVLVNHNDFIDSDRRIQLVFSNLWELRKEQNGENPNWVKLLKISISHGFEARFHLGLVTCSNDGRRVLILVDGVSLVWCDLETNKFDKVAVSGMQMHRIGVTYHTCTFVESLVPVAKIEAMPTVEGATPRMELCPLASS